jgi:hypothetical protein
MDGVSAGDKVTISGVLRSEKEWGPPYWGERPETDLRWTAWIIDTDDVIHLVNAVVVNGQSNKEVSKVQIKPLFIESQATLLPPLQGRRIVTTGKLWPATTASDVTPMVLFGETISATARTVCLVVTTNR